jgi:poly(glycerol-phosphate) alpha-glucosyltransferase
VIPLANHFAAEPAMEVQLIGFDAPEDETAASAQVVSAYGPGKFPIALTLSRVLAAGQYNIVHTHGLWSWASVAAAAWARRSQGALIISPHGMLDGWALANSRWRKKAALWLVERHHLSRAFCLHALTEAEARSIINVGHTQAIAVIPNGIDLADQQARGSLPANLAGDNRRVLLFLGRLHPKKGIAPLLKAWAMARSQSPNLSTQWRLVIAGWDDGGHEPGFRQLAAELRIADGVCFCGPLFGEEKAAAYAHAAAFILPSHSEGLPMTVLEAWSHSRAVFATKHCNLPEGFAAGAALEISTSAAEMADVLVRALQNPARLAAIGAAGRQLVERQFTWPHVARQWREVYAWAAGLRSAPNCVLFPLPEAA